MVVYIIRRVIVAAIVVLGVTLVTFTLLNIIDPSPARVVLGLRANPAAIASWNHQHGYDKPFFVQYWRYLDQLVNGNLGYSYKLDQSVSTLLASDGGRSAVMTAASLILAIAIAIPLGIFQAVKRNSVPDYVFTAGAFTTYSMPSFFLGLILIAIFSKGVGVLNWLPSEASQAQTVLGVIKDPIPMILPVATLTGVTVANFSRYMRSSAIDVLAQDYIRVAKAKGLSQRMVLTRHLLRNASLPMVTLIGLSIPTLLAGNLITENVFNFNGVGVLFFNSLQSFDYPILLAYTLIGAILTVIGNLVADLALTVADPRIRLR